MRLTEPAATGGAIGLALPTALLALSCAHPPPYGEAPPDIDGGSTTLDWPADLPPMIRAPAGTHTIGSPPDEVGHTEDETRVQVHLSSDWWIGSTELTQAAWVARTGSLPRDDDLCTDDCPVRWVHWHQAAAFTVLLSEELGLAPCYICEGDGEAVRCAALGPAVACPGVRLPTEAEWEVAARAGQDGSFPLGGDLEPGTEGSCAGELVLAGGGLLDEQGWYCGNSGSRPQPVGGRAANAWGLSDVAGNVYEHVHDGYSPYVDGATDPEGPQDDALRVHRGGSWGSEPRNLRLARRSTGEGTQVTGGLGFRLAMTAGD